MEIIGWGRRKIVEFEVEQETEKTTEKSKSAKDKQWCCSVLSLGVGPGGSRG